ncbi:hypothetical protein CAPTEDRAFT_227392 [Capitella teleta]|uniref:Kinetochore protein NDC80 n=1 Tax=Capitella teleta TaxID=283909 RepID=R7TE90_CAPTE|nr:hypothetical protein CAPTEDRAFT_227392 [Capitella teleta]|eukprot:ELT92083.1 hypothetical protein CAPTEDRAFT_227392 [Capitella teleta]
MDKKRRGAENLSTFMDDVMPTPQCKENIEAAVAHPLQMLAEKKALTKENKTLKRKLEATADECQANETQEQTEQMASGDSGRPSMGPLRVKNDRGSVSKPKAGEISCKPSTFTLGILPQDSKDAFLAWVLAQRVPRRVRRTTVGGDFIKETRPISSRAFKDESIRSLLTFMYNLLDPSYKVNANGKVEEEIPRLVKELGYPLNITRSALLSVGSPHVWPSLLAMLAWLCNMIEVTEETDVDDLLFPVASDAAFDSVNSENRLKWQFAEKSYQQFMQGADSFEELEDEFTRQTAMFSGDDGDTNELKLKCEELQNALNILEDEPDELSTKRELLMTHNTDAAKLENFVTSLEQHLNKDDPTNLQIEIQDLEAELSGLLTDNKKKEGILETQEFSQSDVDKIKTERQEIQRQAERAETEKHNIEELIWEHEMQIGKQNTQIEDLCQEYNKVAMSAHLIPASAKNAHGIDYRLWPDTMSKHEHAKFAANIQPALNQILMKSRNSVRQLSEMKLNAKEDFEQLAEQLAERQDSLQQEQAALKRMDDSHALKKEQLQNEVQRLDADLEKLRNEICALQASACGAQSGDEHQSQLKMARERFAAQKQIRDRELKEMVSLTRFSLSAIIGHKMKMQQSVQGAVEYLEKQVEKSGKKK